jgi:hypothetical protein
MKPEIQRQRTFHIVHFTLRLGQSIELIAELACCLQDGGDRPQVVASPVQA